MGLTGKIVLVIILLALVVWGLEALVAGHFLNQFSEYRS